MSLGVVDIDGILANFIRGFTAVLKTYDPQAPIVPSHSNVPHWDLTEWYWPKAPREYVRELNEQAWEALKSGALRGFWETLEPQDAGAIRLVQRAHRYLPIVFLTRRDGPTAFRETHQWLESWGIEEPTVVRVRSGEEKGGFARIYGAQWAVEDSPVNIACLSLSGVTTYMPLFPYNRHVGDMDRVIPVNSPEEAIERALLR